MAQPWMDVNVLISAWLNAIFALVCVHRDFAATAKRFAAVETNEAKSLWWTWSGWNGTIATDI